MSSGRAASLKITTHNLWHGFGTAGTGRFSSLESTRERKQREREQACVIRDLGADVYLLQEFNGIPRRAPRWAGQLRMDLHSQLDAVGFKVFGVGYPAHLASGLVTLTRPERRARPLGAISLDQNIFNPMSPFLSLQTREEHFALLDEVIVGGTRILLANVHLHGDVDGDARRAREIGVLLDDLDARADDFDLLVVGGDFNADPGEEVARRMIDAGYVDAWTSSRGADPGYTFDETTNPLTRTVADRTQAPRTPELAARERRPRRIDYVWIRDPRTLVRVDRIDLIKTAPAVSDHYGVCVDLIIR